MKTIYIILISAFLVSCGQSMYNNEITELYPEFVKKYEPKQNKTRADEVISNPYLDYTLVNKNSGQAFSGKLSGKNTSDLNVEYVFKDGRIKLMNTYNRNNNLKYRMNYFTGKFFELHDNGKLKREVDYNTMWASTFYENGNIRSESNDSCMFTYYPSGQLEKKYELFSDLTDVQKLAVFHGAFEMYYPNGVKKAMGQYNEENIDGVWTYYDDEGKVVEQEVYDNGFKIER